MLTDLSDEQGFRLAPLTELGVELPPLPYYLQPKVEKKPSEYEDFFKAEEFIFCFVELY